jgi:osmotically-inducible protein OsmY
VSTSSSYRRRSRLSAYLGTILVGIAWAAAPVSADESARAQPARPLDSIVVTAKKRSDPAVDEAVRKDVEAALHSDPYFYDEHVTVTTKNGVVTLTGIVFDDGDLRAAIRIARRIAGVRRVVNDLEIKLGGE